MKSAKVAGVPAITFRVGNLDFYLAQAGKHIVLASDQRSFASAISTIEGHEPPVAQSATYKETMAGLGDSNLLTLYVNLAPIQGFGYLAEGLGCPQLSPDRGSIANYLEGIQAMGAGLGFDGEAASLTIFCRAKPGAGSTIGPMLAAGAAIGAAVLIPTIERRREIARGEKQWLEDFANDTLNYAMNHGGKLPPSASWRSDVFGAAASPASPDGSIYAFNKNLGGLNLNNITNKSTLIMFFEAKPGLPNASGSRANAVLPYCGTGFFAYADGHVERLKEVPAQEHWVAKYAAPKPAKKAPSHRKG